MRLVAAKVTLEFLASRETFPILREAMCTTSIPITTILAEKVGTLREKGLALAFGGGATFSAEAPGCDR